MENVLSDYDKAFAKTCDRVSAAILVLAERIESLKKSALDDDALSHEISLGIRKGLFGADAESNASILDR